jgi:surfactin synthase thioesterase subunit
MCDAGGPPAPERLACETGRWVGGNDNDWSTDASVRLFCFPHAGGGAMFFRPWRPALAPDIDVRAVQLPGREARIDEPPYRRMDQLLDPLCTALEPYLDRPYALFGHSMGSVVAYEVARRLSADFGHSPVCLVVSGRRAPGLPSDRRLLSGLPDDDFVAEVGRFNGMPPEVLREPDLVSMLLPALRADFELAEAYRPLPGQRLSCRIAAYMGTADREVDHAGLLAWRDETDGEFSIRDFSGDHFYLKGDLPNVLRAVRQDLRAAVARIG